MNPLKILADARFEVFQGFKFSDIFGEFVVEFGQVALPDLFGDDLEADFLAGQVRVVVVLRRGQPHPPLFPRSDSNELVVQVVVGPIGTADL